MKIRTIIKITFRFFSLNLIPSIPTKEDKFIQHILLKQEPEYLQDFCIQKSQQHYDMLLSKIHLKLHRKAEISVKVHTKFHKEFLDEFLWTFLKNFISN